METVKQRKGFKESWRKFLVSLKKRPHNIALVAMLITYIVYSIQLSLISSTTAVVNKSPMGLCEFAVMLLSLLAMVTFLNAFPKREKPKTVFVVLLYVIIAICIVADIVYLVRINEGINADGFDAEKNFFVYDCKTLMIWHLALEILSVVLIALIPVFGYLFNKIDTSVDLGENEIKAIEVSED